MVAVQLVSGLLCAAAAWPWTPAPVSASSTTPASPSTSLTGRYAGELGVVDVVEGNDGVVVGVVAPGVADPCFPAGTEVLRGARVGDSVIATVTTCAWSTTTGPRSVCGRQAVQGMFLVVDRNRWQGSLEPHPVGNTGPLAGCQPALISPRLQLERDTGRPLAPPRMRRDPAAAALAAAAAEQAMAVHDVAAAAAACDRAVAADPRSDVAWSCRGVVLAMQGKPQEALLAYSEALALNPSNHDVSYNVACAFAVMGQKEAALEQLELALVNGFVEHDVIVADSAPGGELASLQSEPRFVRLLATTAPPPPNEPVDKKSSKKAKIK